MKDELKIWQASKSEDLLKYLNFVQEKLDYLTKVKYKVDEIIQRRQNPSH